MSREWGSGGPAVAVRAASVPAAVGPAERSATDIRFLQRDGLAILALIWGNVLGDWPAMVAWIGLILWSMRGPSAAVRALVLGTLLNFLNPGLFGISEMGSTLRWVLLLVAASQVWLRVLQHPEACGWSNVRGWFRPLLRFVVVVLLLSVLFSYFPIVSVLKLCAFVLGFTTLMLGLGQSRGYDWLGWLHTLIAVILISSIPLTVLPVGFFLNKISFQGVLNQPQTYGILIIPPIIYLTVAALLRGSKRLGWANIFMLTAGWGTVVLSQTRTAVFAAALALITVAGYLIVTRWKTWVRFVHRALSYGRLAVGMFLLIGLAVAAPALGDEVGDFLMKRARFRDAATAASFGIAVNTQGLLTTRQDWVQRQISNFRQRPLTGIGFGVPSDARMMMVDRSEGLGIPVSAPVEKGVLFTAIFEETGIMGGLLFFWFLFALARPVLRSENVAAMALLVTVIVINAGEAAFFSAGGLGLIMWFYIGVARLSAGVGAHTPKPAREPAGEPRAAVSP
jgi:hypothetical protein